MRRFLALGVAIACASLACKKNDVPPAEVGCRDVDAPVLTLPGEASFAQMCAVCHGEAGQGATAPTLVDTALSEEQLSSIIGSSMPPGDPARCAGDCAAEVAAFVKSELTSGLLACEEIRAPRQQLRLLSRREYRNSLRDVLKPASPSPSACSLQSECAWGDRCEEGRCVATRCDRTVFAFVGTTSAVQLAGSFNGWEGWPMKKSGNEWVLDVALPAGTHQYKFVVDGEWIADARNPQGVDDGFGGTNSVLDVACPDSAAHIDAIPVENRPAQFPFDNYAPAARVTAQHLDAYFDSAAEVAFTVDPDALHACSAAERNACAAEFVEAVGRRAFRRPLTPDEVQRYAALAATESMAREGLQLALQGLLSSPHFLYRSEIGDDVGSGRFVLTSYERATQLSYFFWGTTPPDWLLDRAEAGELETPAQIEAAARTLLSDARSREQIAAFARQWLDLDAVHTMVKQPDLFGELTPSLRSAMRESTEKLVVDTVAGGGTLSDLLLADTVPANEELAALYGITASTVTVLEPTPWDRPGLLGQASILSVTAHSDQTSPVRRGLFVRRRLLCQDLPPPPPDAGGVPEVDATASTRDRFMQHSSDPVCFGCHQYIDGVGFGFEAYDPIGRLRATDNGHPIDDTGVIADLEGLGTNTETSFTGITELSSALAASDAVDACFVRQMYRFALGTEADLYSRCSREGLTERLQASGGNISELMIAVFLDESAGTRRAP